jgi:hypothetical protein
MNQPPEASGGGRMPATRLVSPGICRTCSDRAKVMRRGKSTQRAEDVLKFAQRSYPPFTGTLFILQWDPLAQGARIGSPSVGPR